MFYYIFSYFLRLIYFLIGNSLGKLVAQTTLVKILYTELFFIFFFSHYWWKKTILLMKKNFKVQFYLVLGLKCSLFSLWEKQCICSEEEYKVILLTKLLHSRVIVHRQILMKVGKRAWFETDNIMRNLVLIYGWGKVK